MRRSIRILTLLAAMMLSVAPTSAYADHDFVDTDDPIEIAFVDWCARDWESSTEKVFEYFSRRSDCYHEAQQKADLFYSISSDQERKEMLYEECMLADYSYSKYQRGIDEIRSETARLEGNSRVHNKSTFCSQKAREILPRGFWFLSRA